VDAVHLILCLALSQIYVVCLPSAMCRLYYLHRLYNKY
jgi:hypothetical protein